jgi:hypothetical protein
MLKYGTAGHAGSPVNLAVAPEFTEKDCHELRCGSLRHLTVNSQYRWNTGLNQQRSEGQSGCIAIVASAAARHKHHQQGASLAGPGNMFNQLAGRHWLRMTLLIFKPEVRPGAIEGAMRYQI